MKRWIYLALFEGLACAAAWSGASAQGATEGYALVVGSNLGGPGQDALRYAEEDANRVGEVLTSLGGYSRDHVQTLLRPTAASMRAAIERIRARVLPLAANRTQWRFFFYYSGHARADALNLGNEELPLSELRERLLGLPATLSIVVLDACQSGAFSRVKGAGRASDFSFNSVERLNTEGMAVIASSSEKELSQESETLRSSFFTHHWLVALRGGGDRDGDGRVTLSEAYQYAYNHTLATTAQTVIGEQHATLETNFKGKDDIPLTHPAAANAHLRIPAPFTGRVLIQSLPSWSVWAELDKTAGEPIVLALPAGAYAASLRQVGGVARCALSLRDGSEAVLDASRCIVVPVAESEAKGTRTPADQTGWDAGSGGTEEGWILELTGGLGWGSHNDAYTRRLQDFDLQRDGDNIGRFSIGIGRRVHHHLLLGLNYFNLESLEWLRDREVKQGFSWAAHAVGPFVQGDLTVGRRRLVNLFGRAGAGISIAWTDFDAVKPEHGFLNANPALQDTTVQTQQITQHFVRPCAWLSAGVSLMPWRNVGFHLELRYVFAPGIQNDFKETHDVGGVALTTGIRLRSWE